MRNFFYFVFFLFFFIPSSILSAEEKVVFIDLNYVLNKSNVGKKILDELNVINEKNKEKFSNEESLLEKERNDIKKLKNIISKDEYNNKVALFKEKVEAYNTKKKILLNLSKIKRNKN